VVARFIVVAALTTCVVRLTGCGSSSPVDGAGEPTAIAISPPTLDIAGGEARSFSARVTDAQGRQVVGADVAYSCDSRIGVVDASAGLFAAAEVTAITTGLVTATVRGTSLTDTCAVTVRATAESRGYSGSGPCKDCHNDIYAPWQQSAHAKMMREYVAGIPDVPDPAAGGLDATKTELVLGASGQRREFLTLSDDGSELLVMPRRYCMATGQWMDIDAQDWQQRPWRVYCAGCHATGFSESMTPPGVYAEASIGCEACHGPGAAHIGSRLPDDVVRPGVLAPDARDSICASCHSRGRSTDGVHAFSTSYRPGESLADSLIPVADGDTAAFWPTGDPTIVVSRLNHQQALDIARTGSHAPCTSCHEPHGPTGFRAQLKRDPDNGDLCLSCHGEVDPVAHSHHPASDTGGAGVGCLQCHMPKTATSAVPLDIASHRISTVPPRASLATVAGDEVLPNSCMNGGCHQTADPANPEMPVYVYSTAGLQAAQAKFDEWFPPPQ